MNGDITLAALCHCQRASKVISSFIIFTGRMPQSGKLRVLNLLTGQKSGFSPRRGDSLHRFTSNLAVQNVTSIATRGGNAALKYAKKINFLVKSRPVGATPLTDFENF